MPILNIIILFTWQYGFRGGRFTIKAIDTLVREVLNIHSFSSEQYNYKNIHDLHSSYVTNDWRCSAFVSNAKISL